MGKAKSSQERGPGRVIGPDYENRQIERGPEPRLRDVNETHVEIMLRAPERYCSVKMMDLRTDIPL